MNWVGNFVDHLETTLKIKNCITFRYGCFSCDYNICDDCLAETEREKENVSATDEVLNAKSVPVQDKKDENENDAGENDNVVENLGGTLDNCTNGNASPVEMKGLDYDDIPLIDGSICEADEISILVEKIKARPKYLPGGRKFHCRSQ